MKGEVVTKTKITIRLFQEIEKRRMREVLITISTILISTLLTFAQTIDFRSISEQLIDLGDVSVDNTDYSEYAALDTLLNNVEIVMLGEQSHGDATTYATKIKLIKYLHKKLGFHLLVFESGIYDAYKAWHLIEEGMDVREAMGHSISAVWSTTESIIPLANYIQENKDQNQLKLLGFDCQFYTNLSKKYLLSDLSKYLYKVDETILDAANWKHLKENLEYSFKYEKKKLKNNQPELDTTYLDQLIQRLDTLPVDTQTDFWLQVLKNVKIHLLDYAFEIDQRDKQMAENLIWLKDKFPNKKIICWGATSHFLYNSTKVRMKRPFIQLLYGRYFKKQPMMGHYIKKHYGEKVYTIGFTTYRGHYGLDKNKKIKTAKKGTFESLLSQSDHNNFLLPLKGLNFKNYKSRPLGHQYMKNDIAEVMDAVIFNRNMYPTRTDLHFYLMIYPENKYIKL